MHVYVCVDQSAAHINYENFLFDYAKLHEHAEICVLSRIMPNQILNKQ